MTAYENMTETIKKATSATNTCRSIKANTRLFH